LCSVTRDVTPLPRSILPVVLVGVTRPVALQTKR